MTQIEVAPILVATRVAGLCLAAPPFTAAGLGVRMRLGIAVVLTLLLAPAATSLAIVPEDAWGWVVSLLGELLIGAGVGWSAALVVLGAKQAGELVAAQAGLSPAALLDPDSGDEITALGSLYGWIALGVFLAFDGPVELVRALANTLRLIPPGGGLIAEETATELLARVGEGMKLAISMAAPAALALAIAGAALGLIGRAAPSLPLIAMSMPIRFVIGMILVAVGAAASAGLLENVWRVWAGG